MSEIPNSISSSEALAKEDAGPGPKEAINSNAVINPPDQCDQEPVSYSDLQIAEALRRKGLVDAYLTLKKGTPEQPGMRPRAAAARLREDRVTLDRWTERFLKSGFDGLIPQTHLRGRKKNSI